VDSGLAASRSFEGGRTRYETRGLEHHDHMICQRTGKIIEFRSDEIEELQENLARKLGFKLLRHRHELYGYLEGTAPKKS
jgi:Fur family ferric uptake transcriptional regulator